jgi:hypothetical protein
MTFVAEGLSIDEVPKETSPDVFKRGWCSMWMMRLDISVDISYILVYLIIVYVIYPNLSYIICVYIYIHVYIYIYVIFYDILIIQASCTYLINIDSMIHYWEDHFAVSSRA